MAEDEEHIAQLVVFKLTKEGFGVTVARNGGEAVQFLHLKNWSVIILDIMMPICDGWEVLKTIRRQKSLSKTPVLMLSAKRPEQVPKEELHLGTEHYLSKPFDPSELSAKIKQMVGE